MTILQMEDIGEYGFDAGPIWDQREVVRTIHVISRLPDVSIVLSQTVPPRSDFASLRDLLAKEGGNLLVEFLRRRLADDSVCNALQLLACIY